MSTGKVDHLTATLWAGLLPYRKEVHMRKTTTKLFLLLAVFGALSGGVAGVAQAKHGADDTQVEDVSGVDGAGHH